MLDKELYKCGIPKFKIDVFGNALMSLPEGSQVKFEINDQGQLIVSGDKYQGYSLIGDEIVYSFVGDFCKDPVQINNCCEK